MRSGATSARFWMPPKIVDGDDIMARRGRKGMTAGAGGSGSGTTRRGGTAATRASASSMDWAVNRSDRKSVGEGKSVSVRVDLGGRRSIKKKNKEDKRDDEGTTEYRDLNKNTV